MENDIEDKILVDFYRWAVFKNGNKLFDLPKLDFEMTVPIKTDWAMRNIGKLKGFDIEDFIVNKLKELNAK